TLPNGTVGVPYSQTITASGGTAPYSFVVTAGAVPNGLTLSSSGVLSGTPTTAGSFGFTVTAIDQFGCAGSAAPNVDRPLTINKATATITLSNLSQTYNGTAKSATATTNPAGKTVVLSYSQNGTSVASPTNAGRYDVTATINDANYQGSTTGVLVINKATPTLTWSNPSDITYGIALSATQLNATANVPGSFTYIPASGTVLNAGNNQTLSVSCAPTDTANYNSTSKNV